MVFLVYVLFHFIFNKYLYVLVYYLLKTLALVLTAAGYVLLERKTLGSLQRRKGPNVVGYGWLQLIADAFKLLSKEVVFPKGVNFYLYSVAPTILFIIIVIC